jgi:hypothetical protein
MPPKGSKRAPSRREKRDGLERARDEQKNCKAQSKATKRSRSLSAEWEPKSRKASKVKAKPVDAATTSAPAPLVKDTAVQDTASKERPRREKRLSTKAGETPFWLAPAVAAKPARRASKENDKKSKKKRVKPQLIGVQLDQKPAATIYIPFRQTDPMTTSVARQQDQPAIRQRWTELTAVGHILADEVDQHIHDNDHELSEGEKRQMNSWSESVQNRIYHTSTLVLENTKLSAELREGQKASDAMRDEMTVLRARMKMTRDEAEQLEGNVEQAIKRTSALQGATQLLAALESLAKQATSDGVSGDDASTR